MKGEDPKRTGEIGPPRDLTNDRNGHEELNVDLSLGDYREAISSNEPMMAQLGAYQETSELLQLARLATANREALYHIVHHSPICGTIDGRVVRADSQPGR